MRPAAVNEINLKIDEAIQRERPYATGQADLKRYQAYVQQMYGLIEAGHPIEHPDIRRMAANVAAIEATF